MISADWIANRPTGPQPQTATVSPSLDLGVLRRHPAGRQDVGEEQHLVVLEMVGNDDRPDVGIGHADIFGLPAGIAAGEVRIAEGGAHWMAHQQPRGIRGFGPGCCCRTR